MGNETKGHGLISACTHNGSAVAVVKNVQGSSQLTKMIIKGQGKRGPSVKAIVGVDRSALLAFVGQPRIAWGTKGSLVVPVIRADAATIDTHAWTNMVAFEDGYSATDGDGNHDTISQMFEYEGDGDTDNYSYTPAA